MKTHRNQFFLSSASRISSMLTQLYISRLYQITLVLVLGVSIPFSPAAPSGFSDWYKKGVELEAKKNWGQAVEAYQQALKLNPDDPKANKAMARAARQSLSKKPTNKKLQNTYIKAVRNSGNNAKLLKALEYVIQGDLNAHQTRFTLAGMLLKNGDSAKAYQQYKKACNLSPKNKKHCKTFLELINTEKRVKDNFYFLRRMAKEKDASLQVRLLYAQSCAKKNHLTNAWKEYQIIYKQNKGLLTRDSDAIQIYYWKKQYAIVLELADKYLRENPQDIKVRETQIKCYQKQNASEEKIRRAIKALVHYNPQTKKWWLDLAKLEISAGNAEAALKYAKKQIERNPRSKAGYQFLLPLVARNPKEQNTYRKALNKLIELDPKSSIERRKMLGLLEFEKKNYRKAEKLLAQSAKQFPKNHELWYALGVSRLKLNIEGKSKGAFSKSYQLAPDSVKYARALGQLLKTDQELRNHLQLFRLLERHSPTIDEKIKIARSYSLNGNQKSAGQTWKKLIDKEPLFLISHPGAVVPMINAGYLSDILKNYQNYQNSFEVNMALGEKLAEIDQRQEALGYLITAYKINPSSVELLLIIARINGELERYSQGLDAFVHALALNPKSTSIQEKAIELALKSGDWENLRKICQVIISKDEMSHKAHFQLANAFFMQGNSDSAVININRAVQLQPSNREYQALKTHLR